MSKAIDEKKRPITTAAVYAILSTLKTYVDTSDDACADLARATAEALCDLNARIQGLEDLQGQPFGDIIANSINTQVVPLVGGKSMVLVGSGTPASNPDFVGQIYIDTTGPNFYFSTGTGSGGWEKVVYDASYVHTDNNFTNALKTKLDNLYTKAQLDTMFGDKEDSFTLTYDAQNHALVSSKTITVS